MLEVVAVANPFEPAVLLMVAIPGVDEVQVADDVRFCMLPFEYVPVAVSCAVVPGAMLEFGGVTDKETSVAGVPEFTPEVPQPCTNAVKITAVSMTNNASKLFFMLSLRGRFDITGGGYSRRCNPFIAYCLLHVTPAQIVSINNYSYLFLSRRSYYTCSDITIAIAP